MVSFVQGSVTLALLGYASSLLGFSLQPHHRLLRQDALAESLQERIDSYYAGDGFPKAERTLQQKIDEATAFLAHEIPKSGAVGVGVSVVYQDQVVLLNGYGLGRFNDSLSAVAVDDIFQIGSVTKMVIGLGIGLLVDDGLLDWHDPVTKYLPWFKLFDKYAEEHVRIGDLLSMNSGLGRRHDFSIYSGAYNSSRRLVEMLEFSEPEHSLRATPAYANVNFEILGELISAVAGRSWPEFLDDRIWTPLNMTHTFASVHDVPQELRETSLNYGHLSCESDVLTFDISTSLATDLSPGYPHLACGSIVSSPRDMSMLLRLMLNKGTVDGVAVFNSTAVISSMITGKNLAYDQLLADGAPLVELLGVHFPTDGESLTAGYGLDMIGDIMWGHAYYDKGGDTFVHHTDTGFIQHEGLGVALQTNTQGVAFNMSQIRSYVMGIFLDVPTESLDFQFQKWRAAQPPPEAPMVGAPACGFSFWKNPPRLALPATESEALVGEYAATVSPKYLPRVAISPSTVENEFRLHVGALNVTMFYVGNDTTGSMTFMTEGDVSITLPSITAAPDAEQEGGFALRVFGHSYRKV